MNVSKLAITLAISALLVTGCGLKDNNAIIKVNGKPITQSEYEKLFEQSVKGSPLAQMVDLKGNKDGFLYLMTEQRVVNQLIIQELLEQEVQARGIKVTNKDVEAELKKIIEQRGGREQFAKDLKANGVTPSEFKKNLLTQVKMQKLANSTGNTEVTDKDCEDFYKKNPKEFKSPEQVRASHILIAANEYQLGEKIKEKSKKEIAAKDLETQVKAEVTKKKELAEKLAKELKADSSKFAEYAKKYSEDPGSAKQGGDLGFFAKRQMVPEFADVAFSAKPNTVSDVVKTQFGYHIIMVKDRKAAGIIPYEKAKSDIKEYLKMEKQIKALDDLTQVAKKNADIQYLDESYNPDVIQKKLSKQVDDATGGQATKVKEATKKQEASKK